MDNTGDKYPQYLSLSKSSSEPSSTLRHVKLSSYLFPLQLIA